MKPKIYLIITTLFSSFDSDYDLTNEIQQRIKLVPSAFVGLAHRVFFDRSFTVSTKVIVYRAVCLSILLYGCESWVPYRRYNMKAEYRDRHKSIWATTASSLLILDGGLWGQRGNRYASKPTTLQHCNSTFGNGGWSACVERVPNALRNKRQLHQLSKLGHWIWIHEFLITTLVAHSALVYNLVIAVLLLYNTGHSCPRPCRTAGGRWSHHLKHWIFGLSKHSGCRLCTLYNASMLPMSRYVVCNVVTA